MKSGKKTLALMCASVLVACMAFMSAGCLSAGDGGSGGGSGGSGSSGSSDSGPGGVSGYSGSGGSGSSGYRGSGGAGSSGSESPAPSESPEPSAPSSPSTPSAPEASTAVVRTIVGTWEISSGTKPDGSAYDMDDLGGKIKLVVESKTEATFYFMGRDPFSGTLERNPSRDAYYSSAKFGTPTTKEAYKLSGPSSYWELVFVIPDDPSYSCWWYLEVGDTGDISHLVLTYAGSGGTTNVGGDAGAAPMDTSPFVGTWKLDYAEDSSGEPYDLTNLDDSVVLVVKSEDDATFYYFERDPFSGKLVRDASGDDYYKTSGYKTECYHLVRSDGQYWEFCFVTDLEDGDVFFYLEVGPEDDYDCLYLAHDASYSGPSSSGSGSSGSGSGTPSAGGGTDSTVPALAGTWVLDYAHDNTGQAYDITSASRKVKLVIRSDETATFYYFDNDPFNGTMMREATRDSYYDTNPKYTVQCYHLLGASGQYWEFVYIFPKDNSSDPFFYFEIGEEDDYDSLYLAKQ